VYGGRTYIRAEVHGGWLASIASAPGDRLRRGTYQETTSVPTSYEGAGLTVRGPGSACNDIHGSFTIHRIGFARSGRMKHVDFTFHSYCDGSGAGIHGRVRWNARSDTVGPGAVSGLAVQRGAASLRLTWRNPGAADFAETTVRWYAGDGPASSLSDAARRTKSLSRRSAAITTDPRRGVVVSLIPLDSTGNHGRRTYLRIPPEG